MAHPIESPGVAPAAKSRGSSKLRALFRRRIRQLFIAAAGLTIVLALAATVFAVWWLTSLNGLPDVGDPFDAAAFGTFELPDEQNAFTYLRQAQASLTPYPSAPSGGVPAVLSLTWLQVDPALKQWVAANSWALELFMKGAAMADGIARPDEASGRRHARGVYPGGLCLLALLEGERREANGDMAAAWECYRAVLRIATHLRRRGSLVERVWANLAHDQLRARLGAWIVNPSTTPGQIRRALDEVVASEPGAEWDEYSLKVEYLELVRALERRVAGVNHSPRDLLTFELAGLEVPPEIAAHFFSAERFVLREPERSRRAAQLLFANWLAHAHARRQGTGQPATALGGLYHRARPTLALRLYPVAADAPAAARALSPDVLASWLDTTRDLRLVFRSVLWPSVRYKERSGHHELVVALAEALYVREHGSPPPSENALVGSYLEFLPDDGSADLDYAGPPSASAASVSSAIQSP
jgi:hypothetical protein